MVARSRNHLCHGNAKIPSISRWVLPPKGNNGFPLHYCRVTKYFILLNNTKVKVVTSRARSFCLISTKSGLSRRTFIKTSDIKFCEYLSSGSRADTCGQTDGRTNMTKVSGAFTCRKSRRKFSCFVFPLFCNRFNTGEDHKLRSFS